jgi:hypothetical protein
MTTFDEPGHTLNGSIRMSLVLDPDLRRDDGFRHDRRSSELGGMTTLYMIDDLRSSEDDDIPRNLQSYIPFPISPLETTPAHAHTAP